MFDKKIKSIKNQMKKKDIGIINEYVVENRHVLATDINALIIYDMNNDKPYVSFYVSTLPAAVAQTTLELIKIKELKNLEVLHEFYCDNEGSLCVGPQAIHEFQNSIKTDAVNEFLREQQMLRMLSQSPFGQYVN